MLQNTLVAVLATVCRCRVFTLSWYTVRLQKSSVCNNWCCAAASLITMEELFVILFSKNVGRPLLGIF
jgi:hypothetical protein